MIAAQQEQTGTRSNLRHERNLLVLAGVFVLLNHTTLLFARTAPIYDIWPVVVWAACSSVLHLALNRLLPERDPIILPIVMLLTGWGLTLVARLAPAFEVRQAIWVVVSCAALLAAAALPPKLRILHRYRYTWLLLGIVLLAMTLIFGVNPSGNQFAPRLWLGFRFVFFQPSEILKLLVIVFLASYLAEKREIIVSNRMHIGGWVLPPLPYLAPMLLMWGFCMVLLIWQRDLGAASLFFLIFLALLYISTGQAGYAAAGLVLLVAGGVMGYLLFDVVELRIETWLNPWPEADTRAFQIVQSLISVAAGGLFGQGVGLGAPTFVPVVHSDFVFAAITEEWGLVGALGALAAIAILVLHSMRIALDNSQHQFRALLAAGVGASIGIQTLMITAGVLKLIPLTGVTFPFVSYGGSSLLSSFIMIGLLLRVSDAESTFDLGSLRPRTRRDNAEFLP